MMKRAVIALAVLAAFAEPASAQSPPLDIAGIEQATGMKGTYNADEKVFKVSKPRPDMNAMVDYWGQGKADDLAKAVRTAVNLTATKVNP
jgi:hypothetical protein